MIAVFAGLSAGVVISALRMKPFGFVLHDGQLDRVMDFASHRAFACAAWSGEAVGPEGGSIYTLAAHLRSTENLTGLPARIALPFGYSPTMLWILGPFCLLPERAAFAAWILAGLLITIIVVQRAGVHWRALLALITPVTIYAVALGQTAILSTAALLFLIYDDRKSDSSAVSWKSALVLWLLTAKPPLAAGAGVALLARGRWRTVLVSLVITAASTFALLPWLGAGWWRDYIGLLRGYDRLHLPPAFSWSIVPESMSNLRAALHSDFGIRDDAAVSASTIVWASSCAALLVAARRMVLDRGMAWSLSILAFLLFCPHVSATEELALCCIPVTMEHPRLSDSVVTGAIILVLVGLVLSPAMGPLAERRPSALFFAKLALAGTVLASRAPLTMRDRRG